MTAAPRRPRADALRNRARLLAVAIDVFGEKGTSVSTEEIARAAGVGIGTVFRHFPTKEALLEAVFLEYLRGFVESARARCEAPDPGQAFFAFFRDAVDVAPRKMAFADALVAVGIDARAAAEEVAGDLSSVLATLLRRAQETRAVRPDLGLPELRALLIGATRAAEQLSGDAEAQGRVLDVLLTGLKAGAQG